MATDILDSRDLIERLEELEAEETLEEDEKDELEAIKELADCGIEDWEYGAALIHEDYFTEYAQELAEDIGAIDRNASWPMPYIDWDEAANALKPDYICVKYLGEWYYVR